MKWCNNKEDNNEEGDNKMEEMTKPNLVIKPLHNYSNYILIYYFYNFFINQNLIKVIKILYNLL